MTRWGPGWFRRWTYCQVDMVGPVLVEPNRLPRSLYVDRSNVEPDGYARTTRCADSEMLPW